MKEDLYRSLQKRKEMLTKKKKNLEILRRKNNGMDKSRGKQTTLLMGFAKNCLIVEAKNIIHYDAQCIKRKYLTQLH